MRQSDSRVCRSNLALRCLKVVKFTTFWIRLSIRCWWFLNSLLLGQVTWSPHYISTRSWQIFRYFMVSDTSIKHFLAICFWGLPLQSANTKTKQNTCMFNQNVTSRKNFRLWPVFPESLYSNFKQYFSYFGCNSTSQHWKDWHVLFAYKFVGLW